MSVENIDIKRIKESLSIFDIDEVIEILESGLKPDEFVYPGYTDVLFSLITRGYPNYVKAIIESEIGFDFQKNGFNYLLASLMGVNPNNRDFSIFKMLIPVVGEDMYTQKDESGLNPWTYSFHSGFFKPVEIFLETGVDWNIKDHRGATGLFYYLRHNNVSDNFLKLILRNKNKINWNQKDNMGVSLKDILLSARHSYDWMSPKNHKLLLDKLEIDYER